MAKRMSLAQIRALDKLRAGRHEAGHITYGEVNGMPVSARLWKPSDAPKSFAESQRQKCWLGRAFFLPDDFARLTMLEKAAFGLAGAIAQEEEGADSAEEVLDCWNSFNFSATDLYFIPPNWDEKRSSCKFVLAAVEEAIAVLSSNNKLLKTITDTLVREEVYNKHGLLLENMEKNAIRLF